jgi:hypothetical protein
LKSRASDATVLFLLLQVQQKKALDCFAARNATMPMGVFPRNAWLAAAFLVLFDTEAIRSFAAGNAATKG